MNTWISEGAKCAQIYATSGPWRRLVGALRHFKTRSSSLGPWRLEVLAGGGHVRSHVIHRSVELHVRLGMWTLGVKASLKNILLSNRWKEQIDLC